MDTARVARYLATGLIGISVNLGLYRVLVEYAHVHYLTGSIIAVSCSTVVGFVLQKYWTFGERTHERVHTQFMLYIVVALANIGLNTFIVYLLAGKLGVYYLVAQAVAAALVAFWSFFVYRSIIFASADASSAGSGGGGIPL